MFTILEMIFEAISDWLSWPIVQACTYSGLILGLIALGWIEESPLDIIVAAVIFLSLCWAGWVWERRSGEN